MTARAEGYWWVTWDEQVGPKCSVVKVLPSGAVLWPGSPHRDGPRDEVDTMPPNIEWGPYLGKEPGDTDIRQRLDAIEEQLSRIPVPEVSPMAFKLEEGPS